MKLGDLVVPLSPVYYLVEQVQPSVHYAFSLMPKKVYILDTYTLPMVYCAPASTGINSAGYFLLAHGEIKELFLATSLMVGKQVRFSVISSVESDM